MEFNIPETLKEEHDDLHEELARVTDIGGGTGETAKKVAAIMHPHFIKEEEFALPPLGLLAPLAKGEVKKEMEDVLHLTERLKAELSQMLAEHRAIIDSLLKLADVATRENKLEIAFFAKKLILHARTEEEVLYPASILVGEYLKIKLNKQGS